MSIESNSTLGGIFLNPIFIVGTNKVGKSLLCRSLDRHPAILSSSREAPFLAFLGGLMEALETCNANVPREWAARDPRDYLQRSLNVAPEYLYSRLRRVSFESVFGRRYGARAIARKIVVSRNLSIVGRRARWCAETFPAASQYRGLLRLYASARFIYVIRNGMHAVKARMETVRERSGRRLPFEVVCRHWAEGADGYHYLQSADSALPIRFEQMREEPHRSMEKILDFLDVPRHEGPGTFIEQVLSGNSESHRPGHADGGGDSAGNAWSHNQRRAFVEHCGDGMRKLGYPMPFDA